MESLEINIATFINPHCFFVTEADNKHTTFLRDVSARIKKSHVGSKSESFLVDEMVAVYYKSNLVRATILEKSVDRESGVTVYFCWLADYAVLIQAEKLFKLPKEIQKITPRARQACLTNFCYVKEQLELGVTGVIKTVPSIVPTAGVTQYCLDLLLSGYSKLVFEVVEIYNNILVGEVVIHKNGKVLYLSKELCNRNLITIDELIFPRIKFSAKDYIKMNLESVIQLCKTQKIRPPIPDLDQHDTSLSPIKMIDNDLEELDIEQLQVLENGRRRRGVHNISLNSSQTSGSEDDQAKKQGHNKAASLLEKLKKTGKIVSNKGHLSESVSETNAVLKSSEGFNKSQLDLQNKSVSIDKQAKSDVVASKENLNSSVTRNNDDHSHVASPKLSSSESVNSETPLRSKAARALQILKEKKTLALAKKALEVKYDSDGINEELKNPEDVLKLPALKFREQHNSSCSTEGFDTSCDSSFESTETPDNVKKSPFGDITSQRKSKPLGLFLPAGMEGRYNKEQSKATSKRTLIGAKANNTEASMSKLESISTPFDDCPTVKIPKLTGNLTDDQISTEETKEHKNEEESSSSDPTTEVFTKQDFCRLVAGCTCVKCRIALEDDDWDSTIKFKSSENEKKKKPESTGPVIKPQKLLKNTVENETSMQEDEILSIDYSEMTAMEKRMACKVLVHGESIPNPIRRVAQVNIHREIYNNISRLNYKEAKRIQHYAFPAITRNQHVIMINDAGSGKTMAYLPILSSFVMEKEERYSKILKMGGGPIVVILCSNSKKCEEIYDLTKLIFERQRSRVSLVTYPGFGNISNTDILITMPTILTSLISSRATNFKRLCHFVLEDGDVILKSHHELIEKFLAYGDQVLAHRNCPKSIQIILCGEHWTPQIENILKKLNKVPLVCIGNHLEAALYGRIALTMKFLDTACKEENLQSILLDVYKFTKSIIICSPDEIEDIMNYLPFKGIEFTAMEGEEEDIFYKESLWSNAVPGKYSVLLCTDDMYNTMNVTNAQLLIHYSLPSSWTQFIRRFSCLLENNPTPLSVKQKGKGASTFVFIDENCEPRMSKFSNFIKIAGLEKDLPENIKEFFKGVALNQEYKQVAKGIELCETVRIFGKCDLLHCKKRHLLDKARDHSDKLPRNGSITFKIFKMTSATTCSIKLLERFDLKGRSVEQFEDYTEEISEILAKKTNYQGVSKPIENHLYLHKDGDTYCRCKLVAMDEFALVYLLDRGIYCKSGLDRLYKMPEELKKISQQCYEVHFANLIPPHEDTKFSRSAKHKAQFLIDSNCPNSTMTARIVLQLGNNLWLEDVHEVREMYDKSLPTIGYQLARELVKQELAVKSENPLSNLYALSRDAGIELPEYRAEKPKIKKVTVEQAEPQWAFLETDAVNRVWFGCGVSPGEFYVKHQKFSKQLAQLEQDIRDELRKPFYPLPQRIEVGKCYLVKDEVTGDYSRGLVLKISDDEAHVFCVDYGDDVFVPTSTLKHLSNDLISKLPFQTIQCSMYGIKPVDDSWCEEATDLLYKMGFEDDPNIFRTLFVKICSRQKDELISKQNSYSVIVKDGFSERHILLNDLLIDCGFAIPNGDDIKDFELPEMEEESEDEDIEEIIRSDRDIEVEVEHDLHDDSSLNEDAFEMVIFNMEETMKFLNIPAIRTDDKKPIRAKEPEDDLPPMKAAPVVDYLTPVVYWSQTEVQIRLSIKIIDVLEISRISLKHNRIFQFSTETNGKKYNLKLMFYDKLEKTFQYTKLGPEVRVNLTKCKNEDWPRLLHTKDKMKNIRYDLSTIKDDEKPRRMLQLDISDSSSEDDENDGMAYHVCSDLDSEYDYDIPNDEE